MKSFAIPQRTLSCCRTFLRDRSGAAAIEFAFIVPLLLMMYLGTMELSQGIEADKKVSRSASMIGDLVSQETSIKKQDLNDMLVIGESILQPYYRSKPTITITGINISAGLIATTAWRRTIVDGVTSGSGINLIPLTYVPEQMRVANTFLVRVETALSYKPVITWSGTKKIGSTDYSSNFTSIQMAESYFYSPRTATSISCSDC